MATSVRDILAAVESTIRVAPAGDRQAIDEALRALAVIDDLVRDVAGRYAITRAPFDPAMTSTAPPCLSNSTATPPGSDLHGLR